MNDQLIEDIYKCFLENPNENILIISDEKYIMVNLIKFFKKEGLILSISEKRIYIYMKETNGIIYFMKPQLKYIQRICFKNVFFGKAKVIPAEITQNIIARIKR